MDQEERLEQIQVRLEGTEGMPESLAIPARFSSLAFRAVRRRNSSGRSASRRSPEMSGASRCTTARALRRPASHLRRTGLVTDQPLAPHTLLIVDEASTPIGDLAAVATVIALTGKLSASAAARQHPGLQPDAIYLAIDSSYILLGEVAGDG